ncbi:stretch-activated cation channel mid1 [Tilletia horrida]|nr:stretch-activated cation channel mid1 [Tilletia horrida]
MPIPLNTTTATVTNSDGSTSEERTARTKLYVSISVCGGPSIPPYDLNNKTVVNSLSAESSAAEVLQRTLMRAYWTSDQSALSMGASADTGNGGSSQGGQDIDPTTYANVISPGPNATSSDGIRSTHLNGGASLIEVDLNRDQNELFTVGIWPPEDVRGLTNGDWAVRVIASLEVEPELVSTAAGVSLDDTDNSHALVTSSWYSNVSPVNINQTITPNVTVYLLPSEGVVSLDPYFNSSMCALEQSFSLFNATSAITGNRFLSGPVIYNISETTRGVLDTPTSSRIDSKQLAERVRMQVLINNLVPSTNYTAWLRWTRPQQPTTPTGVLGSVLYPAIKFVTKKSNNCRLVTNLDYCPSVAYSIPISPDVPTDVAIAAANLTVTPNLQNFTTTINTFPCGSKQFGQYSFVSTCDDCINAYRDWVCGVVLPRCTDPLTDPDDQSAASQNGKDLTGASTGTNTRLLPYIVNRNVNGSSTSRSPIVDSVLKPGEYGELLPCIYTCHFVSRACPPINGWTWTCPDWDMTAQQDYGTFADAGPGGIGADMNGGDGSGSLSTGRGRNVTGAPGGGLNSTKGAGGNGGKGHDQDHDGSDGSNTGGAGSDAGSGTGTDTTQGDGSTVPGLNQVFSTRGDDLAKGAGQRWGGISRYIATDAFGNQYCNALGLDLVLREDSAARRRTELPLDRLAAGIAVASLTFFISNFL